MKIIVRHRFFHFFEFFFIFVGWNSSHLSMLLIYMFVSILNGTKATASLVIGRQFLFIFISSSLSITSLYIPRRDKSKRTTNKREKKIIGNSFFVIQLNVFECAVHSIQWNKNKNKFSIVWFILSHRLTILFHLFTFRPNPIGPVLTAQKVKIVSAKKEGKLMKISFWRNYRQHVLWLVCHSSSILLFYLLFKRRKTDNHYTLPIIY